MPALRALRVAVAAMSLVVVTAACTSPPKDKASMKGDVKAPVEIGPESTEPTAATAPLGMAALVLTADGIGPLPFGMQVARAVSGLTQALGRAETVTAVPPGANCGATRLFHWKDLDVLVNEVSARSGGTPGLAGWSVAAAGLKTDKGIGIGSTLAAVRAAYGPAVTIAGTTFKVRGANSVITGELDGGSDAARVKKLSAGVSCAV